jgi:hypothetical protein
LGVNSPNPSPTGIWDRIEADVLIARRGRTVKNGNILKEVQVWRNDES